jgi:hypothetical protein
LFRSQPIADPHAILLGTLDSPDSRRKIGTQEPAVRSLIGKPPNGCQAEIDGQGSVTSLFEADAVASDYSFVESEARL